MSLVSMEMMEMMVGALHLVPSLVFSAKSSSAAVHTCLHRRLRLLQVCLSISYFALDDGECTARRGGSDH